MPALDAVADYIQTVSGFACVDKPFTTPDDPQCAVVENHADGTQEHIPDCGRANGHLPCWRAVEKSECPAIYNPISGRDQRASIVIDRGGAMPRTGSNVDIRCATIADNTIM